MRSLGLDVGDKKTGVAISDPQGFLAIPLTVLSSEDEDASIVNILKLVEQYQVVRIVIGLPYSLDGNLGRQANKVIAFVEKLRNVIASRSPEPFFSCYSEGEKRPQNLAQGKPCSERSESIREGAAKQAHLERVDIQFWDERLSTKAVEKLMVEAGTKRNKRKQHRDAMAAAFILQGFLDSRCPEQW